MSAPVCPQCGGPLQFAAAIEIRAEIPLGGEVVRIDEGKLKFAGQPWQLRDTVPEAADDFSEDAVLLRIEVRCSRNDFHALGDEVRGAFEIGQAHGSIEFHEGDVVWTHQNVRRTVQRIEIVGGDRVEWIDEHGERWKGRDVRSVGLLRTEVES